MISFSDLAADVSVGLQPLRLSSSFFLLSFQRSEIVTSAYEPTDEECEWKADEEEELTVSKQVQVTSTHLHASCLMSDVKDQFIISVLALLHAAKQDSSFF